MSKSDEPTKITPEPPELLRNLVWLIQNGRQNWRILILCAAISVMFNVASGFYSYVMDKPTKSAPERHADHLTQADQHLPQLTPLLTPRMLNKVGTAGEQDASGNVEIVDASIMIGKDSKPILKGTIHATGPHSLMGNSQAPWLQVELMHGDAILMILDSAGLAEVRECGAYGAIGGENREIDLSKAAYYKPDLLSYVDSFRIKMPGRSNPYRC